MAYDVVLAERVRKLLHGRRGVTESRMFGGVVYLLNGHIFCGVRGQLLLLQLGVTGVARALEKPHVGEVDFTPRTIKGMVSVSIGGYRSDEDLRAWVSRAVAFVMNASSSLARLSPFARQPLVQSLLRLLFSGGACPRHP